MSVIWNMAPCTFIYRYNYFGAECCPNLQSTSVKKEDARSTETLVFYTIRQGVENEGRDSVVGIDGTLQAGRSGDRLSVKARFYQPVQTGPHSVLYNGYRVVPWGKAVGV